MARPRRKKSKAVLFVIEILVLLLFIAGLFLYGQINSRLDILQDNSAQQEILVNPEVEAVTTTKKENPNPADPAVQAAETVSLTGYTTYALFGIDHRDKNAALGANNSDTMIIASINNDTKELKLVSVFRDTLLNLGDGTFSKANAAYAYGGPSQAVTMLNTNLDLNIEGYATVDFDALVTVIDLLGGLEVPMSYAELVHMNNYCVETSADTGKSYTPIQLPPQPEDQEAIIGVYKLNGVQATSYCRIRYTASLDMGRTERQRLVIQLIIDKMKTAGLSTLFKIMDEVFPMVSTSLSKTDILKLAPLMFGYNLTATAGFPINYKFSNARGSIIVATDLVSNVELLHKFLYGEDYIYTPSATVTANSQKILDIVGGAEQLEDVQVVTPETENGDNDFIIFEEGADGSWEDTTDDYISDTEEVNPDGTNPDGTNPDGTNPDGTVPPEGTDPGVTDPGVTDPGVTDPGVTDPGTGGGDYVDPGTGGGDYVDPGTGGGDYVDPGTGGGDYVDPGTGGGDYVDPGTGGGDSGYVDDGGGDSGFEDIPVIEMPVIETPVAEAPMEEVSVEETPVE